MPYNVQSNDCLEVSFSMRMNGQRLLSVFHYLLEAGGGPIDGLDAIDAANTAINDGSSGHLLGDYAGTVTSALEFEQVVYQWIWVTRRARVVYPPDILAGVLSGAALPQNLSAALTKRTETAGRHGVGTLHMPGLLASNVVAGVLNTTGLANYDVLVTQIPNDISVGGANVLHPVVFNRADISNSAVITSAEAQRTVRTMHRRTVGVGE